MRRYKYLKGSQTVEAAVLMPFIIGVFILCFYLALSFYNRCVMQAEVILAAKQSFYLSGETNVTIKDRSSYVAKTGIKEYTVGGEDLTCSVTVQGDKTGVSASGWQKNISLLPGVSGEEIWKLNVFWEETVSPPEELFRKVQVILFYKELIEKEGKENAEDEAGEI
ncbi:MAG: pilus assembly protein [Lachnospiraceae bacterium]|nr:pilus assembly protein [Lachnospiraceae bacterium]